MTSGWSQTVSPQCSHTVVLFGPKAKVPASLITHLDHFAFIPCEPGWIHLRQTPESHVEKYGLELEVNWALTDFEKEFVMLKSRIWK